MREIDPFAKLDLDRPQRTGLPEIVLAEGKRDDHLRSILHELAEAEDRFLVSRLAGDRVDALLEDRAWAEHATYHEDARLLAYDAPDAPPVPEAGRVGVLAAGTSDWSVAREAELVAGFLGCEVRTAHDVGVAGVHRLYPELDWVRGMDAVVVAAGREGALPTVVAGLVDVPVIGLPVGVGYGVGGKGEAALQGMLQSCSLLTVVNVDAGTVAGACAARIARRVARARGELEDPGAGADGGPDPASGDPRGDPTLDGSQEARSRHG